ncbi:MAG TPA: hypothetical protein VN450_03655 [Candidatus Methylomirabilis sp.]|nr:hypothetical protein [Candidatus Methylomirabilis sp.]
MNSSAGRFTALLWALAAVLSVATAPAGAADQEGCLICHRLELRVADDGAEKILKIHDSPDWVHKELYCSDCHPDARNAPHPVPPGAAQCIGECHGKSDRAIASHRRAAFAGFTESHRRVSPGKSPCRLCHTAADRRGDRSAKEGRCAGCHGKEYDLAAGGPHGVFANTERFCVDCHPAHPETGGGATGIAACVGPGCHARTSAAMRALADHRGQGGKGRGIGHALLFFALAFGGWAAGRALSPPPGDGGDRS